MSQRAFYVATGKICQQIEREYTTAVVEVVATEKKNWTKGDWWCALSLYSSLPTSMWSLLISMVHCTFIICENKRARHVCVCVCSCLLMVMLLHVYIEDVIEALCHCSCWVSDWLDANRELHERCYCVQLLFEQITFDERVQ